MFIVLDFDRNFASGILIRSRVIEIGQVAVESSADEDTSLSDRRLRKAKLCERVLTQFRIRTSRLAVTMTRWRENESTKRDNALTNRKKIVINITKKDDC